MQNNCKPLVRGLYNLARREKLPCVIFADYADRLRKRELCLIKTYVNFFDKQLCLLLALRGI